MKQKKWGADKRSREEKKGPCGLDRKFNINFANRHSLQGGQPEIPEIMHINRISSGNQGRVPS